MEWLVVGIIAFVTSLISGVIGLGGAVLLIPAYLYIPQLFGYQLDVREISGMTSLQVFASSFTSVIMHNKNKYVDKKLVLFIGIPITIASFAGAFFSKFVPAYLILAIFAFLAVLGSALILLKKEDISNTYEFQPIKSILIALLVGFSGGMAGAPGAFILSPLMLTVLKIPVKITIGTTLGIVLFSALAASAGKIATNQVNFHLTIIAILFSIPASIAGSMLSHYFDAKMLRKVLAGVIGIAGIQLWYNIIFH